MLTTLRRRALADLRRRDARAARACPHREGVLTGSAAHPWFRRMTCRQCGGRIATYTVAADGTWTLERYFLATEGPSCVL